jgi:hypothetical protein
MMEKDESKETSGLDQEDGVLNEKEDNASMKPNTNSSDSEEEINCPLFMTGLPKDFSTNPGLAAIASLLEDDEERVEIKEKRRNLELKPSVGGGKVKRNKKSRATNSPYPDKKKASLGEAELFLKMWKL